MPLDTQELCSALQVLAENEDMKVCVHESTKGALITGAVTLVSALVFGAKGMVAGGLLGGTAAAAMAGPYTPVARIISNMSHQEKVRFSNHMRNVLKNINITDAVALMTLVASPEAIGKEVVVRAVASYFGAKV